MFENNCSHVNGPLNDLPKSWGTIASYPFNPQLLRPWLICVVIQGGFSIIEKHSLQLQEATRFCLASPLGNNYHHQVVIHIFGIPSRRRHLAPSSG